MALLMCNMARVAKGSLVLDPYVGTGSILVAAAHHGAYTMGADIDIRVLLPGKGDFQGTGNQQGQRDIFANFEQYRLQPPLGLLRMDMHTPPFRDDLEAVFDAIIGDPPYGVRAGGRKMEPREGVTVRNRATHIPSTKPYLLGECLRDLVSLSARLLKLGGRLVFFVPASVMSYRHVAACRLPLR